jgi:hypothetical protein
MVSLIEYQHFERIQIDRALIDMIEQAARAGNYNIGANAQAIDLWLHANTAIDGSAAQASIAAKLAKGCMDLLGKLTGWRNH